MTFKNLKWKKFFAALLALCMLCCFTGCNKEPEEESSESSDSSQVDTEPVNYHKVGYIFSGNADNELCFTGQINKQRILASNRCSMDTCYIDNVTITDFETAVKKLADAGCTDIVAASSNFSNVIKVISGKYMNLNFIGYGTSSSTANMATYTEHAYEGAYVAGMVAAYNSGNGRIGFVGDTDLLYNRATVNATALGAQWANTQAVVYATNAHADNEIEDAINALINEKGCDVIVCYTATSHSEDYCQKRGVKFIGNLDFSGKEDSYSKMLMYFYCKRDSYFLSQFKQMQMDQWGTENYVGNMGNGAVMVSKALNCKENTQKIMDTLTPYISSGEAYIFEGEMFDNTGIMKLFQTDVMTYSQIYSMDWYVKGVEPIKSFRQPQTDFPPNNFEVKS